MDVGFRPGLGVFRNGEGDFVLLQIVFQLGLVGFRGFLMLSHDVDEFH